MPELAVQDLGVQGLRALRAYGFAVCELGLLCQELVETGIVFISIARRLESSCVLVN